MSVYDGMAFQAGRLLAEVALFFCGIAIVVVLVGGMILYGRIRNGSR